MTAALFVFIYLQKLCFDYGVDYCAAGLGSLK